MYVLLTSIKEIDNLISKVISNIRLKFTIEKNRRCQDFYISNFSVSGSVYGKPELPQISLKNQRCESKGVCGFPIILILRQIMF